jgi:hypothetical protein
MEAKLCFWLFHHHTTTVDDVLAPTECTSLGGIFFTIHEEVQEESGGKAILPGMTWWASWFGGAVSFFLPSFWLALAWMNGKCKESKNKYFFPLIRSLCQCTEHGMVFLSLSWQELSLLN